MSTSSSPLPSLPLEVKHHILRFCGPSTLAKTAQVSLAFLELSSPILYEDVHIHGLEALESLFSTRTQPPSLSIAPFLSLSQILSLTIPLPFQRIAEISQDLSLDRTSSNSPLPLQRLEVSIFIEDDESTVTTCNEVDLFPLVDLLDPIHLCLRASPSDTLLYVGVEAIHPWTRLESLTLVSLSADVRLFWNWPSRVRPHLALVTYQFQQAGRDLHGGLYDDLSHNLLDDLPMPEGVQVAVTVGNEEEREDILGRLEDRVQSGDYGLDGGRVLSQLTVEVRQRA